MRVRSLGALFACVAVLGCASPGPGACGPSTDPVVVTGLSGVLDGTRLAVEIVELIPATCRETDQRVWMLFEDPGAVVTLGPEPTGILSRARVEATDETIFFRDLNVGVRLEYPDAVIGPAVRFAWFSTGTELAAVRCTTPPLACALEE
ncbi:MAG: hypothetical protein KF729_38375 [Sandaracinaceae bacterium]|nr:hypothetical protein [Sandaracinaceae bacterium]